MLWSLMNSTHKLFVEKLNKIGCKTASNNENVICKQTTNGENEKKYPAAIVLHSLNSNHTDL